MKAPFWGSTLFRYSNRVIVINEYQFIDENSKKHISLLEEGYVVDSREEKGYRKLDNI